MKPVKSAARRDLKRYLLPGMPERWCWATCPGCAARILWVPELGLWLDERQFGGAAPKGQCPQVPEHRYVCGKVRYHDQWKAPPRPVGPLVHNVLELQRKYESKPAPAEDLLPEWL